MQQSRMTRDRARNEVRGVSPPHGVLAARLPGRGRGGGDGTPFESPEGVRIESAYPMTAYAPHSRPRPHGLVRRLEDRAPVRLVRGIDRFESCRGVRACCDPEALASVPAPIRPSYSRYLERQNIAFADVRPGVLPRGCPVGMPATGPKAVDGIGGGRPSYAMPHLGEIPAATSHHAVRRVETTYRREVFQPAGNLIDVFA